MGFLRRLIKKAQTDKFGFYSQAEEIALNAPQKKMRGDDARRMFIKNGVTKQELQDLGLDDLFRQDRVTQDEILKVIEENRIEFTATEYRGSAPSNIGFDTDVLSFEEANQGLFVELDDGRKLTYFPFREARDGRVGVFADRNALKAPGFGPDEVVGVLDTGPDTTNFAFVEEVTEGMPVFREGSTDVIGRVKKEFDPESARITEILEDEDLARDALSVGYNRNENILSYIMDENNESIRDFLFEGASLDVLDRTDKDILYDAAYFQMEQQYLDQPLEKVTATVDGNPTPYSMVGNEEDGFALSGLSDPVLLREGREFLNLGVPSLQEAEVQLSAALGRFENIREGDEGNLRWESRTLPGGSNAVETVFELKLPELLFSEEIHYPDAENQVFHVRTKDRLDKNGNLILYVEEFQSDWGQTGRREGFIDPETIEYAESKAKDEFEGLFDIYEGIKAKNSFRLPGFIDQTVRALSEPYNIRDVSPADSVKFGIRSRSMERIKSALDDYKKDITALAKQYRKDAIVASFSEKEKNNILKNIYRGAYLKGQRSQNFYLPEPLKRELLQAEQGPLNSPLEANQTVVRKIISDYVDGDDLEGIDKKLAEFSSEMIAGTTLPEVNEFTLEAKRRLLSGFGAESLGQVQRILKADAAEDIAVTLELEGMPRDAIARLEKAYNNFSTDEKAKKGAKMLSPYTTFVKKAPFVTDTESWNNLGMKYIFDRAAREGYDGVSFTPGEVQKNRWDNPGLIGAYDEQIPFSIKRIFNPSETTTGKPKGKTITVEDEDGIEHTSRVFYLNESTKDGQTIGQKAAKRRGMYTIPPVGLLSLQMLPAEKAQAAEEEQKVKELERTFPDAPERVGRTRSGMPRSEQSSGILGALRGAGEVAYEGLSDFVIEPLIGMSGTEAAFEMGATPEEAEEARRKAIAMVDFETSSPTGRRYKESLRSGLGALGEYLTGQSQRGRTRSGMPLGPSRDPLQFLYQEVVDPASEAVVEGALGIIGLDPRDTPQMERVRKESAKPAVEAFIG